MLLFRHVQRPVVHAGADDGRAVGVVVAVGQGVAGDAVDCVGFCEFFGLWLEEMGANEGNRGLSSARGSSVSSTSSCRALGFRILFEVCSFLHSAYTQLFQRHHWHRHSRTATVCKAGRASSGHLSAEAKGAASHHLDTAFWQPSTRVCPPIFPYTLSGLSPASTHPQRAPSATPNSAHPPPPPPASTSP